MFSNESISKRAAGSAVPAERIADAASVTAFASGCEEAFSTAAARASASSRRMPSAQKTSRTLGLPSVTVPVLSSTTVSTCFAVSSASPDRMRMPFAAPSPVPVITAAGVARPSAQGQAITSTDVHTRKIKDASAPAIAHSMPAASAIPITVGTKMPATLSAVLEMGAFLPCASSTNLMIFAKTVSPPVFVTCMYKTPLPFIVPPVTEEPSVFSTGKLSPVSIDSSTPLKPLSTFPSSGMRWPAFTSRMSPGRMSRASVSSVRSSAAPKFKTFTAVSGAKAISALIALFVFSLLRCSKYFPVITKTSTTADASKYKPCTRSVLSGIKKVKTKL